MLTPRTWLTIRRYGQCQSLALTEARPLIRSSESVLSMQVKWQFGADLKKGCTLIMGLVL